VNEGGKKINKYKDLKLQKNYGLQNDYKHGVKKKKKKKKPHSELNLGQLCQRQARNQLSCCGQQKILSFTRLVK
jgi:hypothetical protein